VPGLSHYRPGDYEPRLVYVVYVGDVKGEGGATTLCPCLSQTNEEGRWRPQSVSCSIAVACRDVNTCCGHNTCWGRDVVATAVLPPRLWCVVIGRSRSVIPHLTCCRQVRSGLRWCGSVVSAAVMGPYRRHGLSRRPAGVWLCGGARLPEP
jgi:hypothetical protein